MHGVQEQSWVSLYSTPPHYTHRAVTWVCFRLGVIQTLQLMSPEIISHIMKKGSLARVQPPYRAAITPLKHKMFQSYDRTEGMKAQKLVQLPKLVMAIGCWHAPSIFYSFICIEIVELRLKTLYT